MARSKEFIEEAYGFDREAYEAHLNERYSKKPNEGAVLPSTYIPPEQFAAEIAQAIEDKDLEDVREELGLPVEPPEEPAEEE